MFENAFMADRKAATKLEGRIGYEMFLAVRGEPPKPYAEKADQSQKARIARLKKAKNDKRKSLELETLSVMERNAWMSTAEIALRLNLTLQSTHNRLRGMRHDKLVETRKDTNFREWRKYGPTAAKDHFVHGEP